MRWFLKKPVILIRDSLPQAVIIPYELYQKQEQEWEKEFLKLMERSKRFKNYLKINLHPMGISFDLQIKINFFTGGQGDFFSGI